MGNLEKKARHNSLQHDPKKSAELLSALVDILKKDNPLPNRPEPKVLSELLSKKKVTKKEAEDDDIESLETKTGIIEVIEEADKDKDEIVTWADKIKQSYAQEEIHNFYAQAAGSYNPATGYDTSQPGVKEVKSELAAYQDGSYFKEDKRDKLPKAITDENSKGYRLSKGDKYQAFIMTDPKNRLHSTWNVIRVVNESYDGKIERNDGLHGQWL